MKIPNRAVAPIKALRRMGFEVSYVGRRPTRQEARS